MSRCSPSIPSPLLCRASAPYPPCPSRILFVARRALGHVPRRVFQYLLSDQTTPERCVEGYHLHRTRFERIAERKLRRRQLTDDCQH
jgi:hypothetical protein